MEHASIIDPVSDICNRRYFDRRIDKETQRSPYYKLPSSVILFKIDESSNVVEQHGRPVSDVVLRKISDLIVKTV